MDIRLLQNNTLNNSTHPPHPEKYHFFSIQPLHFQIIECIYHIFLQTLLSYPGYFQFGPTEITVFCMNLFKKLLHCAVPFVQGCYLEPLTKKQYVLCPRDVIDHSGKILSLIIDG